MEPVFKNEWLAFRVVQMNFELWHDPGLKGGHTVSLLHCHVLLDDADMAWQVLPDLDTDRLLGYLVPVIKYLFLLVILICICDGGVITCRCSGLCRPCKWRRSAWPCIRSKGRWWWSSSLGCSTFWFPNNASGTHHHLEKRKSLATWLIKIS